MPKNTIFNNLSSIVCKTWSAHVSVSSIIVPASGVIPRFSYSLMLGIPCQIDYQPNLQP